MCTDVIITKITFAVLMCERIQDRFVYEYWNGVNEQEETHEEWKLSANNKLNK